MNPTREKEDIVEQPKPMRSMREVLAEKQFRRLWLGQMVSIFGDFVALFAVTTVITFRLHGTPEEVTGIMVAYLLPFALIGPIAGVFVDRWNPRVTMIASDLTPWRTDRLRWSSQQRDSGDCMQSCVRSVPVSGFLPCLCS